MKSTLIVGIGASLLTAGIAKAQQRQDITRKKTYYFFLLIENKEFTKIFSLTGNDLETSELLHSAMFCTNQKNAFLIRKSNVFLFCYQNNFIEKRRKSDF